MMMKFCFVVFVGMLACSDAINVKYRDCGSQVGAVSAVSVDPCTSQPCVLPKGKNYTIGVTFKSAETTAVAHAKVYGKVLGIKVPFALPQPDGCLNSGIACPIQKGQEYTYTATLPISTSYPSVRVIVEWDLMDHENGGNKLFCVLFPISLS